MRKTYWISPEAKWRHGTAGLRVAAVLAAVVLAPPIVVGADSMVGMKMPGMSMSPPTKSASVEPTQQAYTTNHAFLIKLQSSPNPIPYEKYFALQLAVYDAHEPTKALASAHLSVTVGMRHDLKEGFAHGMQSSPQVMAKDGTFTVSGLYFHMQGPWTLEVHVERGGQKGTAYFTLPCCGP